jgi:hypothetical protein
MDIQTITERLHEELRDDPNVVSIGYTKGLSPEKIHIYTDKRKSGYPSLYEGVEVEVIKIGKVQVKKSKDGGI